MLFSDSVGFMIKHTFSGTGNATLNKARAPPEAEPAPITQQGVEVSRPQLQPRHQVSEPLWTAPM
jgi:hypothetical protein